MTDEKEVEFVASYNAKDLILYALSVGFGSNAIISNHPVENNNNELPYLYEEHPEFGAVPTFCLVLAFWATDPNCTDNTHVKGIPPFPPPTMRSTVTIPRTNLRDENNIFKKYPILHTWQSVQWHCDLPVPSQNATQISTRLRGKIIGIAPKSIGTFVTSETTIVEDTTNIQLCTLRSTALVLGIPQETVIPMMMESSSRQFNATSTDKSPTNRKQDFETRRKPDFEWSFETSSTTALLYRLASGDSNQIHVTGDKLLVGLGKNNDDENNNNERPILHGLCTLGIACRAINIFCRGISVNGDDDASAVSSLTRLEGHFTKPVYIGDKLLVRLWEINSTSSNDNDSESVSRHQRNLARKISFVVNNSAGEIVISKGVAELKAAKKRKAAARIMVSKL